MKVPFVNLTYVTEQIKGDFLAAVKQLLDKSSFILTEEVERFETSWAEKCQSKHCIGVSNGSDALYICLLALGIKPGDEVIIQGNAYNACVTAILRVGALPRFADIDEKTLTLDVSQAEALVNKKTKAILPVHLFGQPNNMVQITEFASKHNLLVIEDCAQAHLAEFAGQKVGTFGQVSAFSFYPTKNLGAFGDAGAVITNDKKIYQEVLARRNLGQTVKNQHDYFGLNLRLDSIQAIALQLKLNYLEENTIARQAAAEYYTKLISESGISVKPQGRVEGATHVYHLYVVETLKLDRDELASELAKLGVGTAIHYPTPVYRQPFYRGPQDPCPVTDLVLSRIISLPLYVGITREQQEYVIECLQKVLQ